MWDGEFVGSIGFRWQPGTEALPPSCSANRLRGRAVEARAGLRHDALRLLLPEAKAEGLPTSS